MATAIGYPETVSDGVRSFVFAVDGVEVKAEESDATLTLSCVLTGDESALPRLAGYAAGRMLKENATLSWDSGAILWQEADAHAGDRALARFFEDFMNSCDWWLARIDAEAAQGTSPDDIMMIRP